MDLNNLAAIDYKKSAQQSGAEGESSKKKGPVIYR